MSRVRTRLEQYKAEIEKKSQYKHGLPGSALDIVNTLLNDFEQDEKENGWIPVSERLPEIKQNYAECYLVTDGRFCWMAYWTPEKSGFLLIAQIAKIKLIGQTSWLGCHFQNHIRRTKHGKNNTMPRRGTRKL